MASLGSIGIPIKLLNEAQVRAQTIFDAIFSPDSPHYACGALWWARRVWIVLAVL